MEFGYEDCEVDEDGYLTLKGFRQWLVKSVGVERYRQDPAIHKLVEGSVNTASMLFRAEKELEKHGIVPPRKREYTVEPLKGSMPDLRPLLNWPDS